MISGSSVRSCSTSRHSYASSDTGVSREPALAASEPVKKNALVSRLSWIGPPRYSVSGGIVSGGPFGPSYSTAPASQRRCCGRATPRWSVSVHGSSAQSTARLSSLGQCVSVGPPLSAIASSSGSELPRSRSPRSMQPVPLSRLPPCDVSIASQEPPCRLPPMMVLRRVSGFGCGGMLGTKSDSTVEMPPPNGAELRQTVVLAIVNDASASWNMPPPRTLAELVETVVFSILPPPSESAWKPPPSPPCSGSWGLSTRLAVLRQISEPRMISVLAEALVKPPPLLARFSFIVLSMTVNWPLEELWMPPPSSVARLPDAVTRTNVTRVPLFSTPPPLIGVE